MKAMSLVATAISVAAAVLTLGPVGIPSATADNPVCSADGCAFYTPSRHINCGINSSVFCDVGLKESVSMDSTGAFTVCAVDGCVGNAGIGTPVLVYGRAASFGPFSCLSAESGVTCTASGRGFEASSSGVIPVG